MQLPAHRPPSVEHALFDVVRDRQGAQESERLDTEGLALGDSPGDATDHATDEHLRRPGADNTTHELTVLHCVLVVVELAVALLQRGYTRHGEASTWVRRMTHALDVSRT